MPQVVGTDLGCAPIGQPVDMILMRTDIGCEDRPIRDKFTSRDSSGMIFFLNEMESTSTTWFVRHLQFNRMPLNCKLFAEIARTIHVKMLECSVIFTKSLMDMSAKSFDFATKEEPKAKHSRLDAVALKRKPVSALHG